MGRRQRVVFRDAIAPRSERRVAVAAGSRSEFPGSAALIRASAPRLPGALCSYSSSHRTSSSNSPHLSRKKLAEHSGRPTAKGERRGCFTVVDTDEGCILTLSGITIGGQATRTTAVLRDLLRLLGRRCQSINLVDGRKSLLPELQSTLPQVWSVRSASSGSTAHGCESC
jgi:hypothetical protein